VLKEPHCSLNHKVCGYRLCNVPAGVPLDLLLLLLLHQVCH
jgi:hypothetical protein